MTDDVLPANPCTIRRAIKPQRQREPVILTVAEVAKVADAITPARLRALVLISAWCGLRWGEVIELRRKDIGADATVLSVARGVTHRQGCRIDTPKRGKPRVVVVPPHIRADIVRHLAEHVGRTRSIAVPGIPWRMPPRRQDLPQPLQHRAEKHWARRGPGARPAALRRDADGQVGGSLADTMDRLGHSTHGASLIYQHTVSGRDAEIAEALSRLAEESAKTTDHYRAL